MKQVQTMRFDVDTGNGAMPGAPTARVREIMQALDSLPNGLLRGKAWIASHFGWNYGSFTHEIYDPALMDYHVTFAHKALVGSRKTIQAWREAHPNGKA